MTIEEVKEKKRELESEISAVMKEFEESTRLQISSIGFSRCTKSNEFGIEEDYSYNIETHIKL